MHYVLAEYDVIKRAPQVPKKTVRSKAASVDSDAPPLPPKPVSLIIDCHHQDCNNRREGEYPTVSIVPYILTV